MGAFPDIAPNDSGIGSRYRVTPLWGPVSEISFGAPASVAFRKFSRPRYVFDLTWDLFSHDDAEALDLHLKAQRVTFYPFDWFDWYPFWWDGVFIGIGDGSTIAWTLPAKDVTDVQIFSGGSTSGGSDDRAVIGSNITHRTGLNGEDGITLYAPVPNGRPAWAYFRGRRRFEVTCDTDLNQAFTRDAETGLYSLSLKLIQTKITSGS